MLAGTTSSTMSRLGIEFLSALLNQDQAQGECWWKYIGIAGSNPASVGGRKTPIVNSHRSRRLVLDNLKLLSNNFCRMQMELHGRGFESRRLQ